MNINDLLGNYESIIYPILDAHVQLFIATTLTGIASQFVKKLARTVLKILAIVLGVLFVSSFIV